MELVINFAKLNIVQNEQPQNLDYNAPPVRDLQHKDLAETDQIVSPNNPPWNGWAALGVWIASVFFIAVFPGVFLILYAIPAKIDFSDRVKFLEFAQTDPTAIALQLVAIIPAHILTLGLAWMVVTRLNKYSFRETLGWKNNGFKVWHAFAIFVAFYGVAIALTYAIGDVENEFEKMLRASRTAVYLVAFFATFTAPMVEEVVYRGLLYSAFQRRFGIILAVVFITILFTAVHVPQYSVGTTPDFASVITLLLLSLTLTLIRVWTGNLLPCIILHTVFNGVQSVLLLLEPYIKIDPATTPENPASALIRFLT